MCCLLQLLIRPKSRQIRFRAAQLGSANLRIFQGPYRTRQPEARALGQVTLPPLEMSDNFGKMQPRPDHLWLWAGTGILAGFSTVKDAL